MNAYLILYVSHSPGAPWAAKKKMSSVSEKRVDAIPCSITRRACGENEQKKKAQWQTVEITM